MNMTLLSKSGRRLQILSAVIMAAISSPAFIHADSYISVTDILKLHKEGPVCIDQKFLIDAAKDSPLSAAKIRKVPAVINPTVKAEVIIDENFDKWTKGTQAQPSTEQVTDEMVSQLMSYPGDWTLFDMYEAGGAGYMGFDEVSDDGPGYIKSPGVNLKGDDATGIYRFTARVKNINPDAQDQGLQAFMLDEAGSSIISASTQPMEYNNWSECQWVGATSSESTSFMAYGWKGKVLIDGFKVEKLIYPLSSPLVTAATLDADGSIKVEWEKVAKAVSYKVIISGDDTETEMTVGNVSTCNITLDNIDVSVDYVAYVIAYNGDELSYPGYTVCKIEPEQVGATVALEASEINADGFTANWESADYAIRYLIMPTHTYTAKQGGAFSILDEKMTNIPATADSFNPIMVCPMLNMGGADIYWSRPGWTFDLAVFAYMAPDMPAMILSNEYKAYGIIGSITSPETDFSVGGGKITISGYGASAADDAVMECSFVDAQGNVYASTSFELSTIPGNFSVELEGGKADSKFRLSMGETAGEEQVFFTELNISTELAAGDKITVPGRTVHIDNRATSGRVECTVDDSNSYTYQVQGYWSADKMGEPSNIISVSNTTSVKPVDDGAGANVRTFAEGIIISNPEGDDCSVCTLDGKIVYSSNSVNAQVALPKGIYIIKVGQRVFKISK